MSRTYTTMFLGFGAISLAIVASGKLTTGDGFTELHRIGVADSNDLEFIMGLIEKTGESTSARHYHPGGEFGFVIEGAVIVTTESAPAVAIQAGSSFYQPPGEWHAVSTATEGAKTVVFRVLKKGQSMIVPVN